MEYFRELISIAALVFTYGIILFHFGAKLAPKVAKVTTVGNQMWFGNMVSKLTDKIKSNRISRWITNFSYNKLFVCNACHTFWITLLTGTMTNSFLFKDIIMFFIVQLLIVTPCSILAYHIETLKND